MNKTLQEFIAELTRLDIKIDNKTASHLLAWCEQKEANRLVREGRQTGFCPICGSTQAYENE